MTRGQVALLMGLVVTLTMKTSGADVIKNPLEEKKYQNFAEQNNKFGMEVFKVLKRSEEGNFLYSPFSLRTVLAMIKPGARRDTNQELEDALGFSENERQFVEEYSSVLKDIQRNKGNVTIEMANRVYTKLGFKFNSNFKAIQEHYFIAPAKQLDFSKPEKSATTINSWVSGKTDGRIQHLVHPGDFTNETSVVLVNTIRFKGPWLKKFFRRATRKQPFYLDPFKSLQVDMMSTEDYFKVYNMESANARVISMPYMFSDLSSKDDSFHMLIVLPNKINGLHDVENALEQVGYNEILQVMNSKPRNIVLNFPKFSMESSIDFKDLMEKVGVRLIFDEKNADLTGMSWRGEEQLYVSKLKQKTYISVNERGSEAGSATFAAAFTPLSIGPQIEEEITVDRPFLGFIHDSYTNTMLFGFRKTEI